MQKKINISTIALFTALSALVITGCGKKEGKPGKTGAKEGAAAESAAPAAPAENEQNLPYAMKEGKRLFTRYCGVCHGDAGDGTGQYYGFSLKPPPANFTDKAFMKTLTDESIYKVISEGSVSVGKSRMCPPWGKTLNSEEIDFLVDYVKTFAGK